MDKKNLIAFPSIPKSKRLAERARIVAKNFQNEEFGSELMDYLLIEMYNSVLNTNDFDAMAFCQNIQQARAWLEILRGDVDAEIDGD